MQSIPETKICTKCKLILPLEAFYKSKLGKQGRRSICRKCESNLSPAQRELARARYARYRERHRERVRAAMQKWHDEHPDKVKDCARRHYAANQEKRRANARHWRESNPERARERVREYQRRHPDKVAAQNAKRRAAVRSGSFTPEEWADMKAQYDYSCLRCGKREPDIKLHADHVIPLCKNGPHGIENIQPLCAFCNHSKHDKTIDYRPGAVTQCSPLNS